MAAIDVTPAGRRPPHRGGPNAGVTAAGVPIAGVTVALLLLVPAAVGQRPREEPRPHEFITGKDDSLFSLPRSQEDIHQWEEALAELERGELQPAVERLHQVLQHDSGGVVPVETGRFRSLRLCVVLTLANLSPAAAAAYETLVRREAGALMQRPVLELGKDQLRVLAERYPTSAAGKQARLRLGDLALESGDSTAALAHFRAGLDAVPIGSSDEQMLRDRLQAAAVLLTPNVFRSSAPVAGDNVTADVLAVLPGGDTGTRWPACGGGVAGAGMDAVAGTPKNQWSEEVSALGFEYGNGLYAMQPVGDLAGLFVSTGTQLFAFDPLRKAVQWSSPVPLEQAEDSSLNNARSDYGQAYNQEMVLAAACGGEFRGAFRIISKIPERRLFAFQRSTGKLLWSHFDQLEGPIARRFRGHSVAGPPLIVGDTVYAPVHDRSGAIAFCLGAYDLHTGQPRYRKLICSSQQEVNMFGNARSEFASSPLLFDHGVIYGASNLGLAFALDAADGTVRWLSAYEVTRLPQTRLSGQVDRMIYFANNAPAGCAGVIACTPLDSSNALGLDAETGRCLWRLPFSARTGTNNDVRWLCGTIGDEFVFAGGGVVAVKAEPLSAATQQPALRSIQRRENLRSDNGGRAAPRPAVAHGCIYFPAADRLAVFTADGTMAPQAGDVRLRQPGNLLLVDGMIVSLRERQLEVLFDAEALRERAEERLQRDPADPAAILELATLRAALLADSGSGESAAAVEQLYRRGLQAAEQRHLPPAHPVRQALQRELFALAERRAVAARDAGSADDKVLLRTARELAPDTADFLRVQGELIDALQKDGDEAAAVAEIEVAVQRGGDQAYTFRGLGRLPLRAYAAYRRAQLLHEPTAIADNWQQLVELYPDVVIAGQRAADLAGAAIAQLIEKHGDAVYAAIEARAAAALQGAGQDEAALHALAARFPHSKAAVAARTRIVDIAVSRGDIAAACDVLRSALQAGEVAPGLLRRTLLAALHSGNRGLARALAERLRPHAEMRSDWAEDAGISYGEVLSKVKADLEAEVAPRSPSIPKRQIAAIKPRSAQAFRLLPTLYADGFTPPVDVPLFVTCGDLLLAYDLGHLPATPVLYQLQVRFVDQVFVCGRVAVITDTRRVFGIDYRSGQLLWELPNPEERLYECLGVQAGVLHLSAAADQDQDALFLGVEPLLGSALFARPLPVSRMGQKPKAADDQLLLLETPPNGDPVIHRIDPVSGRTAQTVPLSASTLQKLGLRAERAAAKLFPEGLAADKQHVYLPIDSPNLDAPPRVAAIDGRGEIAWTWEGKPGRRLILGALRGNRFAVIEASQHGGSRVLVLDAGNGSELRQTPLGDELNVLNFQRGWIPTPAPAALIIVDRVTAPRLTCVGVDDALPSFQQALATDDDDGAQQPILGNGFLTFGMTPARRGPFRLYALQLADRHGALPDGKKFLSLPLNAPFMVGGAGPYTVVAAEEGLTILGDPDDNR
jgi:outer membrane protein assembly factor BamB